MAVSGTVSTTPFNTLKVIESAFRRCRLTAQQITAEMTAYATDALYLVLSELANPRAPSWCIERQVYPLYQGLSEITLDTGTVDVMNANLRILQHLEGESTTATYTYTCDFTASTDGAATVNVVGIKWAGASAALTFQTSSDGLVWSDVGTQDAGAAAGEWTWYDVVAARSAEYFRFTSPDALVMLEVFLGGLPQEIPMGRLNKDTYVAQSNKVFEGRPLTYWHKRDRTNPKLLLWPAPNSASEHSQIILWRHRHIMDVGTLQQDIEVPQRWLEAIVAKLAAQLALETPAVQADLIPLLDQKASTALALAWSAENDGSSITITPAIGCYTK